MKTVIAGSRSLGLAEVLKAVQRIDWCPSEIVCGCAEGVDRAGREWAIDQGFDVSYFPAWWYQAQWAIDAAKNTNGIIHYPPNGYGRGKGNGFFRNAAMADYAEAVLVVWDGKSQGSDNMRRAAEHRGLILVVWNALKEK